MVPLIRILKGSWPIVRGMLRRMCLLMLILAPIITGCEESAARRDRDHVNAMQRQVTEASKGFITADAEARRGWVEAQTSFEQTRKSIVQQQTDIQSGLDRLEHERKAIVAQRAADGLLSDSIEAIGLVLAVLVPLLLLGWLMHRFWQTDSVPEVDAMIVSTVEASSPPHTVSTEEIWRNLKPVSIAKGRYLPEVVLDDSWSHDT